MARRILLLNPPTDRQIERQRRTGLNLPAFAKEISVRTHTLSRWERYQIDLPAERVAAIRDALDRLEVCR